METIYNGNELMLTDLLIEKTIEENKINAIKIKEISINCYMPHNDMNLWHIVITIKADYNWKSDFYSKKCIHHNYSLTYLQHLENMGVKKLKLNKLKYRSE